MSASNLHRLHLALSDRLERVKNDPQVREAMREAFSQSWEEEFKTQGGGNWAPHDLVKTGDLRNALTKRPKGRFFATYRGVGVRFTVGGAVKHAKYAFKWVRGDVGLEPRIRDRFQKHVTRNLRRYWKARRS